MMVMRMISCGGGVLRRKRYLLYGFLLYTVFGLIELWLLRPLTEQNYRKSRNSQVCPNPYKISEGDVIGPGTVDQKTHITSNVSR